nr:putative reverse transcriptase domain-containing protein [Tanacetum cinerariifolium]GEW47052.1 putative reverse transcriptase domain-containing protein [Tanacetum cinerariifolium]
MEIDLLSNPSEITAPKLMKKMADIYFTRITNDAKSTFSLYARHVALWKSQRGDHTSGWLSATPIFGLGQTMNGKTYRCVLCYRLGIPLFFVSKPCSACSRVFNEDIYGEHDVSCAGIVGIKHLHNMVRNTLIDICFPLGISAGKEVDIGLDGGCDKPLRPPDMILYSWDEGLDVCVDLTGSSPLTQTGMANFIPGRAVIDVAQRKRVKYMAKCAAIGYGFLLFSFSSLGELEDDPVTLLKRILMVIIKNDNNNNNNNNNYQIAKMRRGLSFGVIAGYSSSAVFWVWHRNRVHLSRLCFLDLSVWFSSSCGPNSRVLSRCCGFCISQQEGLSGRLSDGYRLLLTCMLVLGSLLYCFMAIMRFHCLFAGLSGCHDGGGNGLTKTSLITHLRDRHCNGEARAITKHYILFDLVIFERVKHDSFTLSLLDSLFSERLRTVKSIPSKCRLGFSWVLKRAIDKVVRETLAESSSPMVDVDEGDLGLSERNLKQCKRKICDGHYTAAVRVLSSSGVALYNDATLQELKAKHPFKSAPSLPDMPFNNHHLIASQDVVLDRIRSFPQGTSCGQDGLRAKHLMDCLSGAVVAISDELISSITHVVNLFLEGKCLVMLDDLMLGFLEGEAILHAVDRLVEDRKDDVGLSMLLVDFQNDFNLVDRKVMLEEVRLRCTAISRWVEFCYSSPARLYYEEHTLWSYQGFQQGDPLGPLLFSLVLHPLICKIGDSFSLCLQAWYLDDGNIVGDTLVVGKVLELITKNGSRCGLHLNVNKTEIFWPKEDPRSRVEGVFPPNISRPLHGVKLLGGAVSVNFGFSSELAMKRVSKTIELMDAVAKINALNDLTIGNGDSPHYPLHLGAWCLFSSNPSEIAAPKLIKKMADIYFTRVTKDAESIFSLSPQQMALWQSQMEDHTSDWLRVVSISGLGQAMNGKTYRCVLCYRLGVPLFFVSKPCLACSKVFTGDMYGDHAVSCAGIIGIKHRHNVMRDTLVDICFRSGISAGKEVYIGLGGGCDKALRPADMLLYSWDGGLDVCVDLTGSSPLTQTGMADFVPGRAVIDAAQRKRGKYMAKCAAIGYEFVPFSFSSLGELEADAVTLLKRIQKFSMTQDNGARIAIHIFNRISFAIAKGVEAQIVSRLLFNLL